MSGQNFCSQQIKAKFHKGIDDDDDDYEDEFKDFQDELFNFEQNWECHEITEYLKNSSWSKHVKQINEFLMVMWNMCHVVAF